MRRRYMLDTNVLLVASLCWMLFAQGQTDVFNVGLTDDLPEMMTVGIAKEAVKPEPKPDDPVVVPPPAILRAPLPMPPRALVDADDRPRMNHAPSIRRFLLSHLTTGPPLTLIPQG
jgi:hypothetical protein